MSEDRSKPMSDVLADERAAFEQMLVDARWAGLAEGLAEWCLAEAAWNAGKAFALRAKPAGEVVEGNATDAGAVRDAARKLLAWRVGELPHRGWLRDNDLSRAALDELAATLAQLPADPVVQKAHISPAEGEVE